MDNVKAIAKDLKRYEVIKFRRRIYTVISVGEQAVYLLKNRGKRISIELTAEVEVLGKRPEAK